MVFVICRRCDRGQAYCSEPCRRQARLLQRRRANHVYQRSLAARLDHADRQRAYYQRRKLQILTGQGSEVSGASATIPSDITYAAFTRRRREREEPHVQPSSLSVLRKAGPGDMSGIICRKIHSSAAVKCSFRAQPAPDRFRVVRKGASMARDLQLLRNARPLFWPTCGNSIGWRSRSVPTGILSDCARYTRRAGPRFTSMSARTPSIAMAAAAGETLSVSCRSTSIFPFIRAWLT